MDDGALKQTLLFETVKYYEKCLTALPLGFFADSGISLMECDYFPSQNLMTIYTSCKTTAFFPQLK